MGAEGIAGALTEKATGQSAGEAKMTICHKQTETLSISPSAWPAHQAHGDVVGACRTSSLAYLQETPGISAVVRTAAWILLGLVAGLLLVGDPGQLLVGDRANGAKSRDA